MTRYLAEQQTRQFATLDGAKIAYLAAGNPAHPALVLVHGWLSHAGFWRQTLEKYQATHYVLAVDLLGFGFSDKPAAGDYTIPAQAQRVLALLEQLAIPTFDLMGHSMGGQIALQMALLAPQRVRKLVIMGSVVTGALTPYMRAVYTLPMLMGYVFPSVWALSRYGLRHWRWYKYIFLDNAMTYAKDVIPMDGINVAMGVMDGVERPAYKAYVALQAHDLTAQLKHIQSPTLILHGKQDNTVPVSSAYVAQQHVPNNRLVIFDPCGHTPNDEVPEQYFAAVDAFLG